MSCAVKIIRNAPYSNGYDNSTMITNNRHNRRHRTHTRALHVAPKTIQTYLIWLAFFLLKIGFECVCVCVNPFCRRRHRRRLPQIKRTFFILIDYTIDTIDTFGSVNFIILFVQIVCIGNQLLQNTVPNPALTRRTNMKRIAHEFALSAKPNVVQ